MDGNQSSIAEEPILPPHDDQLDELDIQVVPQAADLEQEENYELLEHIFDEGSKHSAEEKKKSAMSHFNSFLRLFYRNKPFIIDGEDIGIPHHTQLSVEDMKDELVGKFATYLGKIAKTKDKKKAPLAYTTARGYFSSFKMYYLHRFREYGTPEVFTPQKFRMYAVNLTALITKRCKKNNEPLVAQKGCAKKEDWVALATLAAWSGQVDCCEFWHFNNNTTQMAARGNEVAYLQHSQITPASMEEDFQNCYTLARVFVNIWKQTSSQECLICPHIDSWQLDWYFSGAALLALNRSPTFMTSPYICPTYGARATKEDSRNKKKSSGVSSLWAEKLRFLNTYQHELNQQVEAARRRREQDSNPPDDNSGVDIFPASSSFRNITSHAGKQYAVQLMGQSLNKLIQIIFRAGWDVQNAHSLFDYLQRESLHDLEAAKACAGWRTKLCDRIYGGYTNRLEDITVDADKFDHFCSVLFHDNAGSRVDRAILRLYGFSVLRFLEDFTKSMASEPTNRWGDGKYHPFVKMVKVARDTCGISQNVFDKWQEDISSTFNIRNAYSLSVEKVAHQKIEGRALIDIYVTLLDLVKSQTASINQLNEKFNALQASLNTSDRKLQDKFNDVMSGLENLSLGRGNARPNPAPLQDQQPASPPQDATNITYSDLLRTGKEMGLDEISFCWFRYDVRKLYGYEKATIDGTSADGKKLLTQLRTHFSSIKSTMHVIIKCLHQYPGPIPSDSGRIGHWEAGLISALRTALNDLKIGLGLEKISKNTVRKHLSAYIERDFPPGTPSEVEAFFKDQGRNKAGRKRRFDETAGDASDSNKRQRNL